MLLKYTDDCINEALPYQRLLSGCMLICLRALV